MLTTYQGECAEYEIPPALRESVLRVTDESRVHDKRTKGYRILKIWGEIMDMQFKARWFK